jgi:IclR family KDG regulon transcriptional repressor
MLEREGFAAKYRIRAVDRALTILKVFRTCGPELTAAEIGTLVGLSPPTTFRMLSTLEAHGFVKQDAATRRYRLGVICLELGSQFLRACQPRSAALSVMTRLQASFGETVHLGRLDGDQIIFVEKLPGLHPIGLMASYVGARAPAHSTALGKAMLAYLPESQLAELLPFRWLPPRTERTIVDLEVLKAELTLVRERRYAIDNQENEVGVKCVAVPIFDHKGIAAALSISGPIERMDAHMQTHGMIEDLKQASVDISTEIGWGRGVDQIKVPGARAA